MEIPTVREVIAAYLADRRRDAAAGLVGKRHVWRVAFYLNSFAETYGALPLPKLPKKSLRTWLRDNPSWRRGSTRDDACRSVIACLRWAEQEERWEHFRIPKPTRPKDLIPATAIRRPLLEAEYRAVLKASRGWSSGYRFGRRRSQVMFRAALCFLWRTGARTCEMRAARFSDVDWTPGRECIRLVEHKTSKKSEEARVIALDALLVSLIRRLHKWREPGQTLIFTNRVGKPLSAMSFADLFRRAARAAGVPDEVSPYACRHAWACRALTAGVSELATAHNLGHATTRTTARYARWVSIQPDQLQRTMAIVNAKGA
jgi:integrase